MAQAGYTPPETRFPLLAQGFLSQTVNLILADINPRDPTNSTVVQK